MLLSGSGPLHGIMVGARNSPTWSLPAFSRSLNQSKSRLAEKQVEPACVQWVLQAVPLLDPCNDARS